MAFSYYDYTGDGVTDTFTITFTYQSTAEISVTVDGVAETGLTFPSTTTVQLTSAPASDALVRVRRTTNLNARSVDFASGSVLTEEDLDNSNIQVFHGSQEAVDYALDSIAKDATGVFDAESTRIKNVADPTATQDAVTKNYLENTWLTTADKAQLNSLDTDNLDTVANDITNVNTVATNIANVNTVAGNNANVTTVATDIANVNTVAADLNEPVSEIDTVANNITNVNTVGGISTDVTTVAGISSDVTAVAADATDIGTVSTNIANVNTVAGISSDVTTVSGINAAVSSVAADATDIGTVSSNIANVNTVAGISADVTTVAADSTDIGTVATNITNVNTVAGISGNVTTVAGISADVTAVAGISGDIQDVQDQLTAIQAVADDLQEVTSEIDTVAASIANVDAVGGSIANVNTVATNVANVNTVAGISSNVTTVAGVAADVSTVAGISANVTTVANNVAGVNSFAERYRVDSSDPTTSLDEGDLAYNTTDNALKYYNGTSWASITAGLTDIVGDATPQLGGNLDLNNSDITGTGNINTSGSLEVDGAVVFNQSGADVDFRVESDGNPNMLRVDAGNNRVGIGVGLPTTSLDVAGTVTMLGADVNGDGDISGNLIVGGTVTADGLTVDTADGSLTVSSGFEINLDRNGTNYIRASNASGGIRLGSGSAYNRLDVASSGDISFYAADQVTQGLFWDASTQRLGLGTTSPSQRLEVSGVVQASSGFVLDDTNLHYLYNVGAGQIGIRFNDGATALGYMWLKDFGSSTRGIGVSSGHLAFATADTERLRIDSSGNLLVGRTSVGTTGTGHSIRGADSAVFVRSGGESIIAARNTSDGQIIRFDKDGTTVGSIASRAGVVTSVILNPASGTGAGISGGTSAVVPADESTIRDNEISLGVSTHRFKDLYLSGGVYLGGTGSANYLDDYEEGTFTPSLGGSPSAPTVSFSSQQGWYRKVGNVVHFIIDVTISSISGGSGGATFTGLPFTSATFANGGYGMIGIRYGASPAITYTKRIYGDSSFVNANDATLYLYGTTSTGTEIQILVSDISTGRIYIYGTYFAA
jgi:hypothetical protein